MRSEAGRRLIVGAICLLHLASCASRSPQRESQTVPLSVCEVFAASSQYRNTVVAVRGRVVSGFEIFVVASDECRIEGDRSSAIWLDMPRSEDFPYADGVGLRQFMAAVTEGRFDALAASLVWYTPEPIKFEETSGWRRLQRALARGRPVSATIIGRFEYADGPFVTRLPDGKVEFSGGFGHLNGYSRRLVIQRIDDVR